MKVRYIACVIAALVTSLFFVGSAGATTTPTSILLSDSSPGVFDTTTTATTTTPDSSSTYYTYSASLDTANTAVTIGSDGYPCGDVAYKATVKHYWGLGWVSWSWTMHFGAHVCHNKVTKKNFLYNSVDSMIPTWSWCGVVYSNWGPTSLPYSSIHGSMEGCFALYDKIIYEELPWAKITIGGNGGLWVRQTGIN